jgi:glycosyltransferase involved in cell wall biosynthesis
MTKSLRRIILVTDAWSPQVNGVVTTLQRITKELECFGVDVKVIQPSDPGHKYLPLPTYPEIPMVWSSPDMESRILSFKPDAIYIATEGGLGWKARKICQKHQLPFVTGFHTKYPEYIHKRFYIPTSWVYRLMKYFHQPAAATLVPSQSLKDELEGRGFKALRLMSRGVQTDVFSPNAKTDLGLPKPVCLYVGRVATEKNLEAFSPINRKD